jgi:hypothetical protein
VREFRRMQALARIRPGAEPELRGYEIFISMGHLRQQLLPGVDIGSNRNLFQELTQRLDRIILRSLAESRLVQGSVCVNLNVSNLLSPDFERLAQKLYERDGAELWVDLDIPDVMANLRDFREAQTIFKRFRVSAMADSLPPELVTTTLRSDLGLQGCKFIYPEDDPELDHLSGAIKRVREAKLVPVLTRVEKDSAIGAGQKANVNAFQGFYVNDLLSGAQTRPVDR